MRAVKAKALRNQAKENAAIQNTTYIQGVKYANGYPYFVRTTYQVSHECARGIYKVLKSVVKEVK